MFAVSWKVVGPDGKPGRMFLAEEYCPTGEQTAILGSAMQYRTVEEAEVAAFNYAAKVPDLLGRFEVVAVKYRDMGYGKMKPYFERV
jgi:hypothetical protein